MLRVIRDLLSDLIQRDSSCLVMDGQMSIPVPNKTQHHKSDRAGGSRA